MALRAADFVGNEPERFEELLQYYLSDEVKIAQRAAYALSYCTDGFPELAVPHIGTLLKATERPVHVAITRNAMRILKFTDIPERWEGPAYDVAWKLVQSVKEDIAVRVHALSVVTNIAFKYPELRAEVLGLAELLCSHDSAGIRSCARKTCARLSK